MKLSKPLFINLVLLVILLNSCKKDTFLDDSSAQLEFSSSSVTFDTVFTTVGSTTKTFKIYNRHNHKMNISNAYLATGSNSPFRLNIDGTSAAAISDIEILANDSLFVFVQVTVDPTGVNSPLLIRDSIIFETNGNNQHVKLSAVGQDVYLHKPTIFPTNGLPAYSVISTSTPWTNDKPHLVFGYAVVDSDSTLTINPGTKVYMNTGAVLWVFIGGSLNVLGEKGNEVTFQGARLEDDYQDIAGQWGKIWMMNGSKDNIIDWAIIKNGSIGLQADSLGSPGIPLLRVSNTIIQNMSSAALYTKGSYVRAVNCVFADAGQYVAALTVGGRYRFDHCTFSNNWDDGFRSAPLFLANNYELINNNYTVRDLDSAYFGNCILYGSLLEEVDLDPSDLAGNFSYKFENCLLKTQLDTSDPTYFVNNILNTDPGFEDESIYDFQLTETSPAVDYGLSSTITTDLNDQTRPNPSSSIPDIGAYEFY